MPLVRGVVVGRTNILSFVCNPGAPPLVSWNLDVDAPLKDNYDNNIHCGRDQQVTTIGQHQSKLLFSPAAPPSHPIRHTPLSRRKAASSGPQHHGARLVAWGHLRRQDFQGTRLEPALQPAAAAVRTGDYSQATQQPQQLHRGVRRLPRVRPAGRFRGIHAHAALRPRAFGRQRAVRDTYAWTLFSVSFPKLLLIFCVYSFFCGT